MNPDKLFDFTEKVALVSGGGAVLRSAIAHAPSRSGARLAIVDRSKENAQRAASQVCESGGEAIGIQADVLEKAGLEKAAAEVIAAGGRADVLINSAGGDKREAPTSGALPFLDLPAESFRSVFDLNLLGAVPACQVVGRCMVRQGRGSILNISSLAAFRSLTRTVA